MRRTKTGRCRNDKYAGREVPGTSAPPPKYPPRFQDRATVSCLRFHNVPLPILMLTEKEWPKAPKEKFHPIASTAHIYPNLQAVAVFKPMWNKLNRREKKAVLIHEWLHILLGHHFRKTPMNIGHREINSRMPKDLKKSLYSAQIKAYKMLSHPRTSNIQDFPLGHARTALYGSSSRLNLGKSKRGYSSIGGCLGRGA